MDLDPGQIHSVSLGRLSVALASLNSMEDEDEHEKVCIHLIIWTLADYEQASDAEEDEKMYCAYILLSGH
jgi:hypothetical protein